jgi:hypothetical protein
MPNKVLTTFPLVIALDVKPSGKNGSNRAFYGSYWRGHPHSAAIAAHETRECRESTGQVLLGTAVALLLIFGLSMLLSLPLAALAFAPVIGYLYHRSFDSFARNVRGEVTECVVESQRYGMSVDAALIEGAAQLMRYKGAPDNMLKILDMMTAELPAARAWVDKNDELVSKALNLQTS